MRVLAIDPGTTQSGYALIDEDYKPLEFGKYDNNEILYVIDNAGFNARNDGEELKVIIEKISSYGQAVGESTFDTCMWIGRFLEFYELEARQKAELVRRKEYVTDLCGNARTNDAAVKMYLVDRFAYGQKNYGKGTKKNPGWFYKFSADVWQAYAIAVWRMDKEYDKASEGKAQQKEC